MGQHFSGVNGFAPAKPLEASDAQMFAIERFMATSEMELVEKYKFPKDEEQGKRLSAEFAGLIPANILKIDGGEIDWREAITRFLVWQGHPIKTAHSLADVAHALSELHSNRRGPKRKGPRLYPRNNFIWMTDGFDRRTTGFPYRKGENYKAHVGANAKLSEMVEVRVRAVLGRVLKRDVTVSQMFTWWLRKNMPGARPDALSKDRYNTVANELEHLEEYMGNDTLECLGWSTGSQYIEWATARQIKSQSPDADPSEIRYIARTTARMHVQTLVMVVRWYFQECNIDPVVIKIPNVRRPAVQYLTAEEIIRLISAARGKIYDLSGNIIGHHDKHERYECVVRFIIIYLYGGTRHANILLLTWFQDIIFGHINAELGLIERQGAGADITPKRKGASWLIGSLVELAKRWFAEDEVKRKQFPGRYVHIIHDEEGKSLANLEPGKDRDIRRRMIKRFDEVRQLAGLPHVRPHMLKHSGVTFAVRAGMPLADVELSFSTSLVTLWTYYVHLRPQFSTPRQYDPALLKLVNLRKLSSKPLSRVLLVEAAPAPPTQVIAGIVSGHA
ncbi:hypothetical protein [uncultured Bradyrhizobium sp.]|jgi:integrase|uniref:hypothetical protein n=1 Tax=uncultured Bradyrhizobium sp. TaxID=199684 RepID=UPI002627D814|nr:hypothetical protein [uncultured Bradyrhizobium sp.]